LAFFLSFSAILNKKAKMNTSNKWVSIAGINLDIFIYRKRCLHVIKLVLLLLFITTNSFSQSISNYGTSRATGILYGSIASTGNSLSAWRNTTSLIEDDNRSIATDIGFDFWYNGERFTQFSVSTNGFIDFSNSTTDGGPMCGAYGYCNSEFSVSSNGTWLALAPFYDDMTTRAGSDPLGSSIKYLLSGVAPNRVLTIEWISMAVYGNTSPNLNFQVKLYETSGRIEFLYGTMVAGTNVFSYTIGINAASINNSPLPSQLKTQQSANTNTFSNTPQNNLSAMPQTNSQINFVPPTPTVAAGSLNIGSITRTGMTLTWPNWASNEVGYVLYYSVDNVNFFFHSQTAANATSAAITNLLPGTTYYWRVYAVTEGTLSNQLINNATTLAARNVTSVASGRWDTNGTWDCNCVPTQSDNVFIRNGHTIQLRSTNMQCNDLTVGQGTSGVAQFTTNTARTLTINGNLTIQSGASFNQATNSNITHTLNVGGNVVNSGTLNLLVDGDSRCITNFTKTNGNQIVSGSGTTAFYTISLDKGSKSNLVDITTSNFSCDADALTFASGGTFKFSASGVNTFQLFNSTRTIPANGGIWMNSTNGIMQFAASINLVGDLRVDNGTVQIGNAANENLISFGGLFEINGGLVQIAGRYSPNTGSISRYQQTGGSVVCPTVSSTSTTVAPFSMDVVGSSITMTNGSIILQQEGGSGAQNLGFNTSGVTTSNITGGTLQIGNGSTPAGQTFMINAGAPIGNLLIARTNVTAQLTGNDLIVRNNITISDGTLNNGGRNITFGGNWLISGGSFQTTTTGLVTANGANQSLTTNGSAFNNLTLSGSANKSLEDNIRVNGDLTFSTTLIPVHAGFVCTLGGDWINNGTFTRNSETILFNGSSDQTVSGSSLTNLTNITVNKSGGRVLVNGLVDLHRLLTIQSATQFDADGSGSGVLTLLSTGDEPTADASIAALPTGASVTGNVTVQRYMAPEEPGVTRVYRYISSPVSGRSVADWQDDFPVTGNFTNPTTEFPVGSGITSFCGRPLIPTTASLFRYVEPNTGSGAFDLGWVAYPLSGSSTTASLEVGRGYAAFIRECTNATTVDVRGPVNQGTVSFNSLISLTINGNLEDGFNLVGNPFPSAIDWNTNAGWSRTGISPVIYVRDNGGSGGYITYDYTDDVPMVLATGQAFWVRTTSATPNFSVNEQAKTTNAGIFYRTGTQDRLVVSLAKDGITDQAIIKLNPESSARLDDFDGPKMDNALFDISTLSEEGISMAVNSFNQISCGQVLSIRTKDMTNGTYQLSFNLQGKFEGYHAVLFDKFTKTTVVLSETSEYSFVVNSTPASKVLDRFELRFEEFEVNSDLIVSANPTICENQNGSVTVLDSQNSIDYYAVLDNQVVSDTLRGTGGMITLEIPASSLGEFNNIIVMASRACGGVFELTYHVQIKVSRPQLPIVLPSVAQCKSGSVTLAVDQPANGTVQWFSSADATDVLATGTSFITPELTKSKTYYASVLSDGGCQGNRVAVVAKVVSFDDVVINQVGDTLISSYESGNHWYRNGVIIKTETGNKLVTTAPGVYKVVVKVSEQCSSSAEVEVEDLVTGDLDEAMPGISAAPNPAEDFIVVTTDNLFDNEMYLINAVGQKLLTATLQYTENTKQAQFQLRALPEGFYYIRGTRQGKAVIVKIIKK
jgi:trimeric autotransporter adhesin